MQTLLLRLHPNTRHVHAAFSTISNSITSPQNARPLVSLLHYYRSLVESGTLQADPAQAACVDHLHSLAEAVTSYCHAVADWQARCDARAAQAALQRPALVQAELRRLESQSQPTPSSSGTASSMFDWFTRSQPRPSQPPPSLQKLEALAGQRADALLAASLGAPPLPPPPPRGLYIHGPVGSGKTALMDHFYSHIASAQLPALHHKRVHFNAALLDLHAAIHVEETARRAARLGESTEFKRAKLAKLALRRVARERLQADPEEYAASLAAANSSIMITAARQLMLEGAEKGGRVPAVLCFDEVQVTDPFNAAVFKALVEAAVEDGVVVVATSNRAPTELARYILTSLLLLL
jgi:predicted ATPase